MARTLRVTPTSLSGKCGVEVVLVIQSMSGLN